MAPSEQELIERGDGVFSAYAVYGPWYVAKVLQGATYWEVSVGPDGRRDFYTDYAEAVAAVERTASRFPRSWRVVRTAMSR